MNTQPSTPPAAPRPLLVVAGMILDAEATALLVSRRRDDDYLGGLWEFPGGKVDPGEDPREALAREIEEELAVRVEVGRVVEVLFDPGARYVVTMLCFACRAEAGAAPRAVEVAEFAWVPLTELDGREFVPADRAFVAALAAAARAGARPLAPFAAAAW